MSREATEKLHLEALDRAYAVNRTIEQLLVEHPAIQADDDLRAALNRLVDAGAELYQAIGRVSGIREDIE